MVSGILFSISVAMLLRTVLVERLAISDILSYNLCIERSFGT